MKNQQVGSISTREKMNDKKPEPERDGTVPTLLRQHEGDLTAIAQLPLPVTDVVSHPEMFVLLSGENDFPYVSERQSLPTAL
jgi:hypothetical protein